jgi:hypothetical protein
MKHVASKDGTTIAYERAGGGPALVLVGGALTSRTFGVNLSLARHLASFFTAVSLRPRRPRRQRRHPAIRRSAGDRGHRGRHRRSGRARLPVRDLLGGDPGTGGGLHAARQGGQAGAVRGGMRRRRHPAARPGRRTLTSGQTDRQRLPRADGPSKRPSVGDMPAEASLGHAERLRQCLGPDRVRAPTARAASPPRSTGYGVRAMAAMSCEYHLRELTAPLPVLHSIYTVSYRWRFAHESAEHSAHVQAPAHP